MRVFGFAKQMKPFVRNRSPAPSVSTLRAGCGELDKVLAFYATAHFLRLVLLRNPGSITTRYLPRFLQ